MAPTSRRSWTFASFAPLVLLVVAAACTDSDSGEEGTGGSGGGDLTLSVDVEKGPHSVLSAVLHVETSKPATVTAEAVGGNHRTTIPAIGDESTKHTIPVVGMRADRTYSLRVRAESSDGDTAEATEEFTTAALPADLPPLDVTVAETSRESPGITLFNATLWGPPEGVAGLFRPGPAPENPKDPSKGEGGFLIGIDGAGEVVWYYRTTQTIGDVSQTERGTILVQLNDVVVREIDLLGDTVREWGSRVATEFAKEDLFGRPLTTEDTDPVPIDSMHHEIDQLPDGNLITLSTKVVELSEADASTLCPDAPDSDVVEDVAVVFSPSGDVVEAWPLTEYFDPVRRPGSDMCISGPPVAPPNWFYPDTEGTRDWTHANAAVIDERTNELQISIRHLDSVIGIRYRADDDGPAGELLWELGAAGTLKLAPGGEQPYHQHAVEPQDDGSILLYDNGNNRPGTGLAGGATPPYSRAVLYRIDRDALTAEQVWEHRDVTPDGTPVYAPFLGDADRLANGNVLITHGAAMTAESVLYARLIEVRPGSGGEDEIVLDVTVGDREEDGWTVYRADRVESLYVERG